MVNKLLTFIIISILLIVSVSAQIDKFGTFKQGDDIRLIQTCSNCTYNNITSIIAPNSTVILSNVVMTPILATEFNYSLNGTYNNEVGTYIVNGIGDKNGLRTIWQYTYDITPSGTPLSDNRTSAVNRTVYFIFFIALLLFLGFLFSKNMTYKISFILLSVLLILVGINFVYIGLQDELVNPVISSFFAKFTAFSFYVYYFIFFLLAVLWIFTFINTIFSKMKERKQQKEDNW